MLGTIDIKSAFQAAPEMARYPMADQGGILYRQVKELATAREETIEKSRLVPEIKAKEDHPSFPVIHFPGDESGRSRGGGQGSRRQFSPQEEPYTPLRLQKNRQGLSRAIREEKMGESVDFVA